MADWTTEEAPKNRAGAPHETELSRVTGNQSFFDYTSAGYTITEATAYWSHVDQLHVPSTHEDKQISPAYLLHRYSFIIIYNYWNSDCVVWMKSFMV